MAAVYPVDKLSKYILVPILALEHLTSTEAKEYVLCPRMTIYTLLAQKKPLFLFNEPIQNTFDKGLFRFAELLDATAESWTAEEQAYVSSHFTEIQEGKFFFDGCRFQIAVSEPDLIEAVRIQSGWRVGWYKHTTEDRQAYREGELLYTPKLWNMSSVLPNTPFTTEPFYFGDIYLRAFREAPFRRLAWEQYLDGYKTYKKNLARAMSEAQS